MYLVCHFSKIASSGVIGKTKQNRGICYKRFCLIGATDLIEIFVKCGDQLYGPFEQNRAEKAITVPEKRDASLTPDVKKSISTKCDLSRL